VGVWLLFTYRQRATSHHLGWFFITSGLVGCCSFGVTLAQDALLWWQLTFTWVCLTMPLAFLGVVLYRGNLTEERLPVLALLSVGALFAAGAWLAPQTFFAGFHVIPQGGVGIGVQPINLLMLAHLSFIVGTCGIITAFSVRFFDLDTKLKVWQMMGLGFMVVFLLGLSTPLDTQIQGYPLPWLAALIYPINTIIAYWVFIVKKPRVRLSYAVALNPAAWHDLRNLVRALSDQTDPRHMQNAVAALQAYIDAVSRPKPIHASYIQKEDVLINAIVRDACDFWRMSAQKKGIAYQTTMPDEELIMTVDPIGLRRALDNLLQNAIKFTPGGGQISILVQLTPHDYAISVQDSGIGIPAKELAQVVHKRGSNARAFAGEGLGLGVVTDFAKHHNGSLHIHSDIGARFTLRLPID